MIGKLDGIILKLVTHDKNAKLLDTLPGIGAYTALFLSSHTGDVNRFPDSRHMSADLGLVPMPHQTGDTKILGHITKTGNKWLRRNLVECARAAVKKDPHLREFYLRLTQEGREEGSDCCGKKITVVRVLDAYERNLTYEELSPWSRS